MTALDSSPSAVSRPNETEASGHSRYGLAPTDLVLAGLAPLLFVAVLAGNWLQLISFGGGLTMFGPTWISVLLISGYFFFFGGPPPGRVAGVAVGSALVTVVMLSIGTLRAGFGGQAIPVFISVVGIVAMIAFGSAVAKYERPNHILATVETALVLQAIMIVPKMALLGTNATFLSSRPFGLAAAVAFAWRLHRQKGPLATAADPLSWVLLGCALLSQSRTALLVMALSLVVSSIAGHRFQARHILRAMLVLAVVVFASVAIVQTSETARNRVFGIESDPTSDAGTELTLNLSNRQNIWPELVREILGDPIAPNGAGSSARFVETFSEGEHANPHNDYLRIAYDAGVVGLAALIGAVVWLGVRAIRLLGVNRQALGTVTICLSIGVAMAFTNVLTYLSVSWPAFLLAAAGVQVAARKPKDRRTVDCRVA